MGDKTGIAWTDATWNPTRGCAPVGEGCRHCYAERAAMRMSNVGGAYEGLVKLTLKGATWTHQGRFVPKLLDQPLRWTKPRKIFVDSMSDLFFEAFSFEQIAAVFGVMALAPQHTFQVLTKRPKRAFQFFDWLGGLHGPGGIAPADPLMGCIMHAGRALDAKYTQRMLKWNNEPAPAWPLPNVWLCVSAWDQDSAADMIPWLLETPAAVRGVSLEPILGPVDLRHLDADKAGHPRMNQIDALTGRHTDMARPCESVPKLDWVIVGGESGQRARPCHMAHLRAVVGQCKDTWRPCFVKQLGAWPVDEGANALARSSWLNHPAGANPKEWPPNLRVQEFPR